MEISDVVRHPTVCISDGLEIKDNHLLLDPNLIDMYVSMIVGSLTIAINGGSSHFRTGHSTITQRVWAMTWLAFGWYFGLSFGPMAETEKMIGVILTAIFFVPAPGGFVVGGQMLMNYGKCIEIDEANV